MHKRSLIGIAGAVIAVAVLLGVMVWQGVALGSANAAFAQGAATATPAAQAPTGQGNHSTSGRPDWSAYVDAFWSALAKQFGLSTTDTKTKVTAAEKDVIEQMVTDGKLTRAQADQMEQGLSTSTPFVPFLRGGKGGRVGGPHGDFLNNTATLEAVAAALNMKPADLIAQLQAGKTLADIATAQNVDQAKVKQAIIDATKAQIQKEVQDGIITQAQADQQLANLTPEKIDLTQIRGFGGWGHGPRGGGNNP